MKRILKEMQLTLASSTIEGFVKEINGLMNKMVQWKARHLDWEVQSVYIESDADEYNPQAQLVIAYNRPETEYEIRQAEIKERQRLADELEQLTELAARHGWPMPAQSNDMTSEQRIAHNVRAIKAAKLEEQRLAAQKDIDADDPFTEVQ